MCYVNSNKLKGKMAENGFNIGTLAKEIGVSRDTISNVFNGKTKPSYLIINQLFFTLKLSPEEIINIFFSKRIS